MKSKQYIYTISQTTGSKSMGKEAVTHLEGQRQNITICIEPQLWQKKNKWKGQEQCWALKVRYFAYDKCILDGRRVLRNGGKGEMGFHLEAAWSHMGRKSKQ